MLIVRSHLLQFIFSNKKSNKILQLMPKFSKKLKPPAFKQNLVSSFISSIFQQNQFMILEVYNKLMGPTHSLYQTCEIDYEDSKTNNYLQNFDIKKLTPQMIKSLEQQRPYATFFKNNIEKMKTLSLGNDTYQGNLNQNLKPINYGKLYKANGTLILGQYIEGILTGKFHTFFIDGSHFFGQLQNNSIKKGKLTHRDGSFQQGRFNNGKIQGRGKQQSQDYIFEGLFQLGKPSQGTLTWKINDQFNSYVGRFDQRGQFTGQGKLIEPLGIYYGNFKNGLKDGHGRYEYKNGLVYEGNYIEGFKTGEGTLYNSDKTVSYSGNFDKGVPNGKGYSFNQFGIKIPSHFFQGLNRIQYELVQAVEAYQKSKA